MVNKQHLTIHLGTDHAGFEHKNEIKDWLKTTGWEVVDHGASHYDEEDDFTDFIAKAAAAVSKDPARSVAVVFGGSGQGEAMVANRFPNVRATVYYAASDEIIVLSREHNDANVISIGARFVTVEEVKQAITLWLKTPFKGEEKRVRRNQKIEHVTKTL